MYTLGFCIVAHVYECAPRTLLCTCVFNVFLAIELAFVKLNLILIRVSPRESVYVIYIYTSSWRRRRLGGRRKKRTG